MKIRTSIVAGLVAASAAGVALVGGAGQARAATAPEVRIILIGSEQWDVHWDTQGRTGCDLVLGSGSVENPKSMDDITPTGYMGVQPNLAADFRVRVTCPDQSYSRWARVYGPRNPINDARTQFNEATQDMFGS